MLVILLLHGIAAAVAPYLVGRFGRFTFLGLSLVPAGGLVWTVRHAGEAVSDGGYVERASWMPTLGVHLDFHVDTLALIMVILVCGIGALIVVYCTSYFDSDEPGLGRFAAMFVAFAGAMFGLVVADDIIMLYIFWELTTVFSYLLIGHDPTKFASRQAALRALIITTLGGLAMLVGLVLLGYLSGSTRLSEIVANPPEQPLTIVALVLILVGALSKSALFPFSFWLPGAMAAPTPVSAYLHAAAMVKGGIYLVARLGPAFGENTTWRVILVSLGLLTMFLGARRALQQYDLKLLLAYGTVSQLGFLMLLVGAGTRDAALAGAAALLAHAFFKATLFMVVGIIDHNTGTRDLRKLAGVANQMPWLVLVSALALASMAGLPPFLGFVSKELAFEAFLHGPNGWLDWLVLAGVVISAALTFAYSARFFWGAFFSKAGLSPCEVHPASWGFLSAPTILAFGGLVLGIGASALDQPLARFADTYAVTVGEPSYLALWHGFNLALGLTALTVLLGLTLTRFQHRAYTASDTRTLFGESEHTYRRTTRLVDRFALVLTGLTQRGSLPVFVGTILVVTVLVPGTALVRAGLIPDEIRLWDTPAQGLVVVFIMAAALLAVWSQHRLQSAILASSTSYGMAVLFFLHGAPDLGLTQFLVEVAALVVFVLILRRLPTHFSGQAGRLRKGFRLAIAVSVGVLMSALAASAVSLRNAPAVSEQMPAAAEAAGGQNIVNVTLVDLRAWDTLGEIYVLAAAAIGVASLVFLRRRTRPLGTVAEASEKPQVWADESAAKPHPAPHRPHADGAAGARVQTWLAGGPTLAPERRSLILEVITRIIFHAMIVLSVYLLVAGHNDPGGGFAGGLVAGLALVLRYLAGGRYELGEALRVDARIPLGIGLVLAVGTGITAMFAGAELLQSGALDLELPVLGEAHLSSTLFFDIGVYLVVIGLIQELLTSLGVQIDRYEDRENQASEREEASS